MLEDKQLNRQLQRLMKLPFAPQDDDGIKGLLEEYRRIANRDAQGLAHFIRAVDHLLDTSSRIPPPAALVEALRETPVPEREKAPMGCEVCLGSGWRSFQNMVYPSGVVPYLADFADFCDCHKGIWMRSKDKERATEKAAKEAQWRYAH